MRNSSSPYCHMYTSLQTLKYYWKSGVLPASIRSRSIQLKITQCGAICALQLFSLFFFEALIRFLHGAAISLLRGQDQLRTAAQVFIYCFIFDNLPHILQD